MSQAIVITASEELEKSIRRYFCYTRNVKTHVIRPPSTSHNSQQWVIRTFRQYANQLETCSEQSGNTLGLSDSLIFIDLFDEELDRFEDLNPAARAQCDWSTVVSMLLLAYPEMHWIFNTPYRMIENPLFQKAHVLGGSNSIRQIIKLHDAEYTPLFDPTGLRHTVRKQILKDVKYVAVRPQAAAAIDEEDDYAYFNSYMAYRLGYRAHIVRSYHMMREVFNAAPRVLPDGERVPDPSGRPPDPNRVELIFEDLFLNFSDQPALDWRLSDLRRRTKEFAGLTHDMQYRVLVTVDHDLDPEKGLENRKFMEAWKNEAGRYERYIGTVTKPLSGFFHLWEESEFKNSGFTPNGMAPGYVWPPPKSAGSPRGDKHKGLKRLVRKPQAASRAAQGPAPSAAEASVNDKEVRDHSAPGRLLEISERLLRRAEHVARDISSVPEAVFGAMLALDAQEYLGHRTPTISLEALALKHKLEVSAECMFYGVAHNKEVKSRFDEITREIDSIGDWLQPQMRERAKLDAEIGIVGQIMLIFRQNYQFDEEQRCLNKLRELNRKLWIRKKRANTLNKKPQKGRRVQYLVKPFVYTGYTGAYWLRSYVEKLINSMPAFLACILIWVFGLSVFYGWACPCGSKRKARLAVQVATVGAAAGVVSEELAVATLQSTGETAAAATLQSTGEVILSGLERVSHFAEHGINHAMTAFFGIQSPHGPEDLEKYGVWPFFITLFAILGGFLHLGIFVSHLYSVISRR